MSPSPFKGGGIKGGAKRYEVFLTYPPSSPFKKIGTNGEWEEILERGEVSPLPILTKEYPIIRVFKRG